MRTKLRFWRRSFSGLFNSIRHYRTIVGFRLGAQRPLSNLTRSSVYPEYNFPARTRACALQHLVRLPCCC
jgi:hypothetical protein